MSTSATVPMLSPTGEVGDVPIEQAHQAVLDGGTLAVDMLSPEGEAGVIPMDKVHDAIRAGGVLKGAGPQAPHPAGEEVPMSATQRAGAAIGNRVDKTIGNVTNAAKKTVGALSGVANDTYDVSTPGIATEIYKHLAGKPNNLDKIPGKAVLAFLAAGGLGEAEIADAADAATTSHTAVEEIAHPSEAELGATGERAAQQPTVKPSNIGPGGGPKKEVIGGPKYPAGRNIGTSPGMQTPGGAVVASRGPKALLPSGETEAASAEKTAPTEAADQPAEASEENARKTEVTKGQKAAAEKAFLDHLGVTKEKIAEAKGKQAQAYQKFLLKAAQNGKEFGPKGGVTPELQEGARNAGRQAYLKHLKIDEAALEEAKSRGRQGAMEHYKKAMQDLTRRPGATQK